MRHKPFSYTSNAQAKGAESRRQRVGEQIRGALMELIIEGRLSDAGAKNTLVTGVDLSPDLRNGKVHVRSDRAETLSDSERKQLIDALTRARGFLQRELSKRLNLRHVPRLAFAWDDSFDHGQRIESLLGELRAVDEGKT